jgi:hypothetical protein
MPHYYCGMVRSHQAGQCGRLPATLRAEGGTHRPCTNCSNIGILLQHADRASGVPRSIGSPYSLSA